MNTKEIRHAEGRLLDLEKVLAYEGGLRLRKVTVRKQGSQWLLVLAGNFDQRPVVCFYGGWSFYGCWENFWNHWDRNAVRWHVDKFYKVDKSE